MFYVNSSGYIHVDKFAKNDAFRNSVRDKKYYYGVLKIHIQNIYDEFSLFEVTFLWERNYSWYYLVKNITKQC